MNRIALAVAILAVSTAPAWAGSFAGTTAGGATGATSASSGSTSGNDKVVLQARDDAATFVASDGRIRGAQLEAALRVLRESGDAAQGASDAQLALDILAL